jgi:hypothetical protein
MDGRHRSHVSCGNGDPRPARVWVTATYLRDGLPYDHGLIRDFHRSGATDLATYAVSDNLGSGLMLLLLVPTVALAVGFLSARLASKATR